MKIFLLYLRQHRNTFVMILIFVITLCVSFALSNLPLKAVLYPMLLCAFLGVIFVALDYISVRDKYKLLVTFEEEVPLLGASLPKYKGPYEAQYQKLILLLREYIKTSENQKEARYNELIDYYTMWVHQIKTPIASMDLALQNEDSPLARKCAADLFRIEQYVNMVLAYLRLDSTSSDYSFKKCSLDAIIRESVKGFSTEFINRKLALSYVPTGYEFTTDSKWLGFVLDQLLSNALKYTLEGSITIAMDEPGILTIKDTGIGISEEDLPRIFENGFTGYNGRSYKRSSGIGLYLCSRICKNLGIELGVKSKVGEGTCFTLNLNNCERSWE